MQWAFSQIGYPDGSYQILHSNIPTRDRDERTLANGFSENSTAQLASTHQLAIQLQETQELLQATALHVGSLAQRQSEAEERMDDIARIVQTNALEIKSLLKSQTVAQDHLTKLAEQNLTQIKSLSENRNADPELMSDFMRRHEAQLRSLVEAQETGFGRLNQALECSNKASNNMLKELKRQQRKNQAFPTDGASDEVHPCSHNVHPPPRKLDRVVVGYDYG